MFAVVQALMQRRQSASRDAGVTVEQPDVIRETDDDVKPAPPTPPGPEGSGETTPVDMEAAGERLARLMAGVFLARRTRMAQQVAAEALAHPVEPGVCAVCMCEGALLVRLCGDDCPGGVCAECLAQHCSLIIEDSYPGICRPMRCPMCPGGKRVVPMARWSRVVTAEALQTWTQRAKGVLSYQCGSCHVRKSQFYECAPEAAAAHVAAWPRVLDALADQEARRELDAALALYVRGDLPQHEVVPPLVRAFGGDATQVDLRALALGLQDHERRATLQSAFYYKFPMIESLCCQRKHCFRCRTKDWHTETCEEKQAAQYRYTRVMPCGVCGIALAKGDGCNSLVCLCGASMNWASAMSAFLVQQALTAHNGDAVAVARAAAALMHRHGTVGDVPAEEMEEAVAVAQSGDHGERVRALHFLMREGEDDVPTAARLALQAMDGESGFSGDSAGSAEFASLYPAAVWEARHGDEAGRMAVLAEAEGEETTESAAWLAQADPEEKLELEATTLASLAAECVAAQNGSVEAACAVLGWAMRNGQALSAAERAFERLHHDEVCAIHRELLEQDLRQAQDELELFKQGPLPPIPEEGAVEAGASAAAAPVKCKHWSTTDKCATCRLTRPEPRTESMLGVIGQVEKLDMRKFELRRLNCRVLALTEQLAAL